jgi:hypothetical protein
VRIEQEPMFRCLRSNQTISPRYNDAMAGLGVSPSSMVTADDIYIDMGKQGRPSPVTPKYLDMAGRTSRASSQYLDMAGRTSRDGLYEDTKRSPRPRADVYMEMDDMVQSPERGRYLEGVAMSPDYAMVASPANGRHLGRSASADSTFLWMASPVHRV